MQKLMSLVLAAALAGCGGEERDPAHGAAQAKAAPAAKKSATESEQLATVGEWRRSNMDGTLALLFGEGRSRPLAALRCDHQLESLLIERMTESPEAGVDTMKVRVDGKIRRLPVTWDGASLPIASAMVKLEDQLTDSLSRVSGTFELELKGEPKLLLPADRRIGTLIEECRQI
jgi:hypothetical protein